MSIALTSSLTNLWDFTASTTSWKVEAASDYSDDKASPPKPRGALSQKSLSSARFISSQFRPEPIVGRATYFHTTAKTELDLIENPTAAHPSLTILDNGLTYFPDSNCGFFIEETSLGTIYEIHGEEKPPAYAVVQYRRGKIVRNGQCFDFVVSSKEGSEPKLAFLVNEQNQVCEVREERGLYHIVPITEKMDAVLNQDTFSCWIRHEGKIYQSSRLGYRERDSGFLFQELGIFVTRQKEIIDLNTPFPHQPQTMCVNGDSCVYWCGRLFFHRRDNIYQEPGSDCHYRLTTYADGGQALIEINGDTVNNGGVDFEVTRHKNPQVWYYTLSSHHEKNTAALTQMTEKSSQDDKAEHYVVVPASRILATSDGVLDDKIDAATNRIVSVYHEETECLCVGSSTVAASHNVTGQITPDGKNFLSKKDWEDRNIKYVIVPGGFVVYKRDITETVPHEWQGTQGILFTKPPLKTWPDQKRFADPKPVNDYKTFIASGQHYAFTPGQTQEGGSSPHLLWQEESGGYFRLVVGAQILTLPQEIHNAHFETAENAKIRRDILEVFHRATTAEKIAELKPFADAFSRQDPVYVKDGKIWNLAEVSRDFKPVMASPFSIHTAHQWRPENVIVFRKFPDGTIRPASREELAAHLDEKLPPLPSPYLDHHHRIMGASYVARIIKKSVARLKPEIITLTPENHLVTRSLTTTSLHMHRIKITRGQKKSDCILFYPTQSDPLVKAAIKDGYYVPTEKDALKLYDTLYKILPEKVADQVKTIRLLPAGSHTTKATYRYSDHELTVYGLQVASQKEWLSHVTGGIIVHEVLGHGLTNPLNDGLIDLALKTLVMDSMLEKYGTTDWAEYIATLAEYYNWQPSRAKQMPWGYRLVHKIVMDFLILAQNS